MYMVATGAHTAHARHTRTRIRFLDHFGVRVTHGLSRPGLRAHQGSVLQVTGSCSRVQVCVLTMVSPCDVETVMV